MLSNAPNASDRADPFLVKNELDNLTKAVDSSIALLAEANGNENLKSKATYTAFRKKPKILEGVHRERRTLQKLRARIKKLDQELAEALNEET